LEKQISLKMSPSKAYCNFVFITRFCVTGRGFAKQLIVICFYIILDVSLYISNVRNAHSASFY